MIKTLIPKSILKPVLITRLLTPISRHRNLQRMPVSLSSSLIEKNLTLHYSWHSLSSKIRISTSRKRAISLYFCPICVFDTSLPWVPLPSKKKSSARALQVPLPSFFCYLPLLIIHPFLVGQLKHTTCNNI